MQKIVDDVSAYYLIGYYSTNTKADGKYRRIEVKMKTPGLNVHARRGYVAPSDTARSTTPATPAVPPAIDHALGSLAHAVGEAELFTYAVANSGDLAVTVELPERAVAAGGDWTKGAKVTVDVLGADGAPVGTGTSSVDAGFRGALVRVPVGAAPGPWKIRARLSSGAASLNNTFDAAPGSGALLGAPLAFRATPSPRSTPLPVADFEFRRTERLHLEWPVLKPLDQRVARVLDRRGQPLAVGATLTEREADGRTSILVDVTLASLAEGDYVVDVTAASGADSQDALFAFRLVR
jgi:hypothetical protein